MDPASELFLSCCEHGNFNQAAYDFSGELMDIPVASEREGYRDSLWELGELLESKDDLGILEWFQLHFPTCMAHVPNHERSNFLAGLYRAFADQQIELDVFFEPVYACPECLLNTLQVKVPLDIVTAGDELWYACGVCGGDFEEDQVHETCEYEEVDDYAGSSEEG